MADDFPKDRTGAQKRMHATPDRMQGKALCAGRFGLIVLALSALVLVRTSAGQSAPDPAEPAEPPAVITPSDAPQPIPPGPMIGVHGVVKDAVSGEPLPRVLVQVDGETGQGILTDGDGKFDFSVPGTGAHVFQLTKPGFHDVPPGPSASGAMLENSNGITHNVFVTGDMPGLSFAMTPTGVIHGHIDLSAADPAQGIGVLLFRRTLQGGHASWLPVANARTNSDGGYRFAGLDSGAYAIVTEPAREGDGPGIPIAPGGPADIAWNGYAATYYPDARDFSGAAKIRVHGGDTIQANLILKLEPFQLVRATLTTAKGALKPPVEYAVSVLDMQGHSLSYPAQYDEDTQSVKAMLPDGAYVLQVNAVQRPQVQQMRIAAARGTFPGGGVILQGAAEITVASRPITGLRIALAERVANPVVVNVTHNSSRPATSTSNGSAISISVTQAGDTKVDGMWAQLAQGNVPGELETTVLAPGSYWVHTSISQPGLCESSFTAGGSSLGHEPLVVSAGGATASLSLALRDDCATLKLNLPPNLMAPAAGEEPAFTVFVVPDFDSTVDVPGLTIRASSSGNLSVDNLTPGNYHVYTFAEPVELEYRNPEVLATLPTVGQAITLEPSMTSNLVLEAPHQ